MEISLSLSSTFILPLSIHHCRVLIKMAKRGITTFSATQVAKQGLAVSTALLKMVDLEKEVSRLRHHVSVLSRRNHGLQKELDGLRIVGEEVASNKEPEPQVVAEPPEPVVDEVVAPSVASDDVASVTSVVLPEAKPAVAELRVALEIGPEVTMVRLPKGKKRRLTVGGDGVEGRDETEVMTVVPFEEERGMIVAPLGPRADLVARGTSELYPWTDGLRVRGWDVVRREVQYMDRSLIRTRNGMIGDSYHTRGGGAPAQVRGNVRGRFVERGIGGGLLGRRYGPFR